jgi:hypothetical protein
MVDVGDDGDVADLWWLMGLLHFLRAQQLAVGDQFAGL